MVHHDLCYVYIAHVSFLIYGVLVLYLSMNLLYRLQVTQNIQDSPEMTTWKM